MSELTGNTHFSSSGAFTDNSSGGADKLKADQAQKAGNEVEGGFQTDVEDIKADGEVRYGKERFPRFDVSPEEFFSNMKADRKRLRFKQNSKAGDYARRTKNQGRAFYIKTKTFDGREFIKKVR